MALIYSAWSDVVRVVAAARPEYAGRAGLIGPSLHLMDGKGRQLYLVYFTHGELHPDGTTVDRESAQFYPEELVLEPDLGIAQGIVAAYQAASDRYHRQGEIVRVVDPEHPYFRRAGWVLDANFDHPAGLLMFRVEFAYGRLHGDGTEEESDSWYFFPGQVARETDPELVRATRARHDKVGEYERGAIVRVHAADHENSTRQDQTGRVTGIDMTEGDKCA